MRRILHGFLFLLFIFLLPLNGDIIIESKNQNIQLLGVPFYEDKSNSLNLQEVQEKKFITNEGQLASFGMRHEIHVRNGEFGAIFEISLPTTTKKNEVT